ncbi:hypothetical protein THAOC_37030 [Thalassiosira oceanica]|uniref:Uncharacterized protein n=1 Tax=Thalassiosira oceanica TaxID=159749 RepID=K0QYT6_THAOC|nr:hypothetical protein THAOC_37030 [Thalassiosira oceanica]|eukprot:EJK44428.1 hypothetical protein THAOC_37030 [Thalassiosira oceanica]
MLLLAAAEKDCGVTWEKRRLPEEWERQTEYKMNLRFTLLSLSVVLSAYSTDSTAAAAADGGPDDKTTCSIEWEKDHGLILHRRKLTLETVDFSSHGGRKLRRNSNWLTEWLNPLFGGGGGGGGGKNECYDAEQQIKDGIAAFKTGEVQGGQRYLEMFHKDAKVNMLAGHTEDGHEINGREHLARFMSDPFGSRNPRDGGRSLSKFIELTASEDTTELTAFEDSEYSSKRSDDGNFCIVYLSVLMTMTTTSGNTGEMTDVTTEGLVRYDVADDDSVISKLSLNVNTGQPDPCSTDRDVDATYGVRE